jgi:hypothetical protein
MKTVLPGAIEDLNYWRDILVVVGGGRLDLYSLESQSAGLGRTEYILKEHSHAAPHKLRIALQSLHLEGKRMHSVNFTTHDSLVVSFVESSPPGQGSIL